MRFTSLGSGSSGNAFLLELDDQRVLIDCGVGVRTIQHALAGSDLPLTVVISHEHGDHVRSLQSVLKKHVCQVVATDGTFGSIGRNDAWHTVRSGERYAWDGISISFVSVDHDAAEPCGFFIETKGISIAALTDLGCSSPEVLDVVGAADIIVLESNYDEGMLRRGRYPAHLKRRIRSSVGHLSNDDCAATLVQAARPSTTGIWLSHLSHNNNTPAAAVATSVEALRASGKDIPVAALARFDTTTILPFVAPPRQASLFDG